MKTIKIVLSDEPAERLHELKEITRITAFLKDFMKDQKPLIKPLTFKGLMETHGGLDVEPKKFSEATEAEKAYLAGSMDYDGCFDIAFRRHSNTYRPRARLRGTSLVPFQLCCKYGGVITLSKVRKGLKPSYLWHIAKHKLLRQFLNTVIPYLRIKKPQALLLLKALDIIEKNGWTDEARATLKKLKKEVSRLNHKAPKIPEIFGKTAPKRTKSSAL